MVPALILPKARKSANSAGLIRLILTTRAIGRKCIDVDRRADSVQAAKPRTPLIIQAVIARMAPATAH
jgi:hypothetical protein